MDPANMRFPVVNLGSSALAGLQDDIAWFEANRAKIAAQYAGQYVVVKDAAVHGAFPDFQSAYAAGVAQFGSQPFLVKQALAQQPTERI